LTGKRTSLRPVHGAQAQGLVHQVSYDLLALRGRHCSGNNDPEEGAGGADGEPENDVDGDGEEAMALSGCE